MIKDNLTKQIKSILIVGPAWIGDMVMAQTLFKVLKANNPSVAIDVLAPSWTLPLVERMPEVRQGILFPFGHGELRLSKRYQFAKQLRNQNYDQAIVLPGSFKSALTVFWAKIPIRTGWLGEWRVGILNDARKLNEKNLPLMIQRFIALGQSKEIPVTSTLDTYYPSLIADNNQQQALLDRLQINVNKPILALCPGAEYGPAKRWPADYFADVARKMLANDWQVWIFGSKKEQDLSQAIMAATNNQGVDLTGRTSLLEALDLLSLAQGVICNDSGLMHMAAALNRPLIVIYGSSSPGFTPPLSQKVEIVHLGLKCSPCFKRVCPLEHFDCMKKITPDLIISKLQSLLSHDQNINC